MEQNETKHYNIVKLNDTSYNMVTTDEFMQDIVRLISKLSVIDDDKYAMIANINLFNELLYRKATSVFIKYLEDEFTPNKVYKLTLTECDDTHELVIRDNVFDTETNATIGVKGVTYGVVMN